MNAKILGCLYFALALSHTLSLPHTLSLSLSLSHDRVGVLGGGASALAQTYSLMSFGCFGPPDFLAMMIWSTLRTVQAALHANLMPQYFVL